jgi:hypothetical protein
MTGGTERTAWDDVFDASRLRDRQVRSLVAPLALMLLLLHVGEIAGRRLLLFAAAAARLRGVRLPAMPRRRPKVKTQKAPTPTAPAATPPEPQTSALERAKSRARKRL